MFPYAHLSGSCKMGKDVQLSERNSDARACLFTQHMKVKNFGLTTFLEEALNDDPVSNRKIYNHTAWPSLNSWKRQSVS